MSYTHTRTHTYSHTPRRVRWRTCARWKSTDCSRLPPHSNNTNHSAAAVEGQTALLSTGVGSFNLVRIQAMVLQFAAKKLSGTNLTFDEARSQLWFYPGIARDGRNEEWLRVLVAKGAATSARPASRGRMVQSTNPMDTILLTAAPFFMEAYQCATYVHHSSLSRFVINRTTTDTPFRIYHGGRKNKVADTYDPPPPCF